MSDLGDSNFIRYIYRGEEGEHILLDATHITIDASVTVIREEAFLEHHNIVEVICHANVKTIERFAFRYCESLRRVTMPGVEVVERDAFEFCKALMDVECGKLEIIKVGAFSCCTSLRSINLPSARIIEDLAFEVSRLEDVKFGNKLERIDARAFNNYRLERITMPLKDGIIGLDAFRGCDNLNHIYLTDEALLHEFIEALHLEDWRNDIKEEINSINQILPETRAGDKDDDFYRTAPKAEAIRTWIRSLLRKLVHYKAKHQRLLGETETTLQFALPHEIVTNNIIPFLDLPPHELAVWRSHWFADWHFSHVDVELPTYYDQSSTHITSTRRVS